MNGGIKLTGNNNIVAFSRDGDLVGVGGYDGSYKICSLSMNKVLFKTKVKGPRNDVIIWHQSISHSQRYFAFSCLRKVFVIDLETKSLIKEIPFSEEEHKHTVSFSFFGESDRLVIPNGRNLILYCITDDTYNEILLPEGSSESSGIAVSADDRYIAYKSENYKLREKIFVFDLHEANNLTEINISGHDCRGHTYLRFISGNKLVALNAKTSEICFFEIPSGELSKTITFEEIGFIRSYWSFEISEDGRFIFSKNATPEKDRLPRDFVISIPEGLENLIYDIELKKIIYRQKHGASGSSMHMETKQYAYLEKKYKNPDMLIVKNIP